MPACENCEAESTQQCSACQQVYYCNRTCQQSDWSKHRPYCTFERFTKWFEEQDLLLQTCQTILRHSEKKKHLLIVNINGYQELQKIQHEGQFFAITYLNAAHQIVKAEEEADIGKIKVFFTVNERVLVATFD